MTNDSTDKTLTRKTRWAWTVATFFGAGFGKPGPGTWGSVAAALLWWLAASFSHVDTTILAQAPKMAQHIRGDVVLSALYRYSAGEITWDDASALMAGVFSGDGRGS